MPLKHFQVVTHGESSTSFDLWALDMNGNLWRTTVHPGKMIVWAQVQGPSPISPQVVELKPNG